MADQNAVLGDDDSPSWLTASQETETQISGFGFAGASSLPAMEWTLSAEFVTESGGVQDAGAKSYGLQLAICNAVLISGKESSNYTLSLNSRGKINIYSHLMHSERYWLPPDWHSEAQDRHSQHPRSTQSAPSEAANAPFEVLRTLLVSELSKRSARTGKSTFHCRIFRLKECLFLVNVKGYESIISLSSAVGL
ncbi:hypothetical protein R1sor_002991 [Riccia sorocarpa]|uniref:Uncharacterized protein n=1 Tax=Riccia sorocarpa TaxID=122646 RepID=A0ABD3H488_9MARC